MHRSLLCLALLATAPLLAQPDQKELAQRIDGYVQPHVGWNVFSGVVLLAKGDEVLFARPYGMANYEFEVPNRLDTRFRIASINKLFTGVVLSRLTVDKKLAPDDPIAKWFPDFPSSDKITVSHLARHRSGIRDPKTLRQSILRSYTPGEAVAIIAKEPLATVPGETYSYTTANYTLLAAIIEKITGKSYNEAMRALLYLPSGAKDTGDVTTTEVIPRLANGYMPNPFGPGVAVSGPEDSSWKAGGGASFTTAADLHRIIRSIYTRKIVPEVEPRNLWPVRKVVERDGVEASGGMPGTSAYMAYLIDDEITVVVLSNNYAGVTGRMGKDILALYFGQSPETPPAVSSSAATFDPKLLGSYEVPATGWRFDITMRDGKPLQSYRDSIRQSRVVARSADEYFIPMDWSVWRLNRDETGNVTGGTMTFVGDPSNPLEFRRIDATPSK